MRIRHFSCHVELKPIVIVYNTITKINLLSTMLALECLIEKNGLKSWFSLLTHIFYKKLVTILDTKLHNL
jgi:hypothetical protein